MQVQSSTAVAFNVSGASASRPPLRYGARGAAVRELQQRLVAHGFKPGPVDGWFGRMTDAAVRAYQRAHGLKVDGYVGPITWASLLRHSAPAPSTPVTRTSSGFAPSGPLNVPFVSQMRVPGGWANYACGPTSLSMLMAYAGRPPPSVVQVCLRAGTQQSSAGTSHDGLVRAARSYGFTPHTGNGWVALSRALASGKPVVAHVTCAPLSNRPYGYRGGHYVVVTGLVRDRSGHITHVVCNDPATSYASRGKGIRYSAREFEQAWGSKSRWFLSL